MSSIFYITKKINSIFLLKFSLHKIKGAAVADVEERINSRASAEYYFRHESKIKKDEGKSQCEGKGKVERGENKKEDR